MHSKKKISKIKIYDFINGYFKLLIRILVFLFAGISRNARIIKNSSNSKNIVVLSFHKIGDSVFTLPAMKLIKEYFKKDIYIFCYEHNKPVYEMIFNGNNIITFTWKEFYLKNRIAKKIIKEKIASLEPLYLIDLTGTVTTASMLIKSKAKHIIGINESVYKPLYTQYVPIAKNCHMRDVYINAITPLISKPSITTLNEYEITDEIFEYILIHPFAGWEAKEWGVNRFIELAKTLIKNYKVIFISEPGKLQKYNIPTGIELAESRNLYELIEYIKNCSLMIGCDSGPIQIAAMFGKPTFTIYGPTNPVMHIPYGEYHWYIQKKIQCSPKDGEKFCFANGGRRGCLSYDCMTSLDVEEVYNRLKEFLLKYGTVKKDSIE